MIEPATQEIEAAFQQLCHRWRGDVDPDRETALRWDITTDSGTRSYEMVIDSSGCRVSTVPTALPRVMVGISLTDFVAMVEGRLVLMSAFLAGRVRLSGDLGLAQQIETGFEKQPDG
jgi:putative sterol carrier protein